MEHVVDAQGFKLQHDRRELRPCMHMYVCVHARKSFCCHGTGIFTNATGIFTNAGRIPAYVRPHAVQMASSRVVVRADTQRSDGQEEGCVRAWE